MTTFICQYLLEHYSILSEDEVLELVPGLNPLALELIESLAAPAPTNRHPVLLCLDETSDIIPWEACSVYKTQPISRVPSVAFALSLRKVGRAVTRSCSTHHAPLLQTSKRVTLLLLGYL